MNDNRDEKIAEGPAEFVVAWMLEDLSKGAVEEANFPLASVNE